jgi:ABC-type Fe3+/spermidine/putrescine transport system ATPase subunit
MSRHDALVADIAARSSRGAAGWADASGGRGALACAVVHTADLSGAAYPAPIARNWAARIVAEFAAQVASEAARGMLYGAEVLAFVRPEDVRLGEAARDQPGAITMDVAHVEFLGATCRISLEAGRLRLEADATAEALRAAGALLGARVAVYVPAAAVMVFPADV